MTNLIALYRGRTFADAHLVAVSSDPGIVGDFAGRLLKSKRTTGDPAVSAIEDGKRQALRIVKRESEE